MEINEAIRRLTKYGDTLKNFEDENGIKMKLDTAIQVVLENRTWISVKDQLPESEILVLVWWEYAGKGHVTIAQLEPVRERARYWQTSGGAVFDLLDHPGSTIKYWQPLPERPEIL